MSSSLIKNSIFNIIYKLLNIFFPLITVTYVAHILMADGLGKVAYAQNIVTYFLTIAALGLPNYGTREIAKVKSDSILTNRLFTELFCINGLSTIFCCFAYFSMISIFDGFHSTINLYYAVGVMLLLNVFNVDWFYQGMEEYAFIAKRSFFVKTLLLITIFLFIHSKEDIVLYALIGSLGVGANHVLNVMNLKKYKVKLIFSSISLSKHLKPIFILLGSVIAVELYTMVDVTMIGILCDDTAVGYYSNSMKIVKLLITVITGIAGVLLPRLSQYYVDGKIEECSRIVSKVLLVMCFCYLPLQVGLLSKADIIFPTLFGESFLPGVATLKITSLLIVALGFSNLFGTQILLTFGQEKKILICTIVAAVLNLTLNLIMIPKFAQNGAAVASVISEGFVTIFTFVHTKKYVKWKIPRRFVFSSAISTASLWIILSLIDRFEMPDIAHLCSSIILGGLVYVGFCTLTGNPVIVELSQLKKGLK